MYVKAYMRSSSHANIGVGTSSAASGLHPLPRSVFVWQVTMYIFFFQCRECGDDSHAWGRCVDIGWNPFFFVCVTSVAFEERHLFEYSFCGGGGGVEVEGGAWARMFLWFAGSSCIDSRLRDWMLLGSC